MPIQLTLTVYNEAQEREMEAAWREIVSGKLTRTDVLDTAVDAVMERARISLRAIERAIRADIATPEARRLVQFLAALYNSRLYSFEFVELRALDTGLANACLDYLNYDRLGKQKVQHHLSGGEAELRVWIQETRVEPRLRLSDEQMKQFNQLVERTGKRGNELLMEGIEGLLERYGRR